MRKTLANTNTTIFRTAILRPAIANLHYGVTVALAFALFPALSAAGLPTTVDWPDFLARYWLGIGIPSIFWACILCLIGLPAHETILPLWHRYRKEPGRLLILIPLLVFLLWLYGPDVFIVVSVIVVATFELVDRTRNTPRGLSNSILSFWLPAVYLFTGLVLVFTYSQIVVASRTHLAHDELLDHIDSWLLLGQTVSEVAHKAINWLPTRVFDLFNFAYLTMYPLVGAGIVATGIGFGRKCAFRYVCTVMTAFYLALLCFYLWPSLSPFYRCATHFAVVPQSLRCYEIQQHLFTSLKLLGGHKPIDKIRTGYYIAFPCMHIAQPVILLWFLRKWKRTLVTLLIYNLFLMVSIVMLEFHYVTDLVGGVAVALLAILMVNGTGRTPEGAREVVP